VLSLCSTITVPKFFVKFLHFCQILAFLSNFAFFVKFCIFFVKFCIFASIFSIFFASNFAFWSNFCQNFYLSQKILFLTNVSTNDHKFGFLTKIRSLTKISLFLDQKRFLTRMMLTQDCHFYQKNWILLLEKNTRFCYKHIW